MKSQVEVYRAKAKEYARLTILTKSLRESRRYRKLAEMYWALALGEKPECVQLRVSGLAPFRRPKRRRRRRLAIAGRQRS